jgi:hypothetical protein
LRKVRRLLRGSYRAAAHLELREVLFGIRERRRDVHPPAAACALAAAAAAVAHGLVAAAGRRPAAAAAASEQLHKRESMQPEFERAGPAARRQLLAVLPRPLEDRPKVAGAELRLGIVWGVGVGQGGEVMGLARRSCMH